MATMMYLALLAIGCGAVAEAPEATPAYTVTPTRDWAALVVRHKDEFTGRLWRDGLGMNTSMPKVTFESPDPGCVEGRIYDAGLGCIFGVYGAASDRSIRVTTADPWQLAHEMAHAAIHSQGGNGALHGYEHQELTTQGANAMWKYAQEIAAWEDAQ